MSPSVRGLHNKGSDGPGSAVSIFRSMGPTVFKSMGPRHREALPSRDELGWTQAGGAGRGTVVGRDWGQGQLLSPPMAGVGHDRQGLGASHSAIEGPGHIWVSPLRGGF